MLLGAAIWNSGGAVFMLAFTDWIFAREGLAPPRVAPFYHVWLALVFAFGVGYYLVYLDMRRNRSILLLGIIGKLAFCATFAAYYLLAPRSLPRFFLIPLAGDLWFSARFAQCLRFTRTADPGIEPVSHASPR
jgi:hypothetical protein